MVHMAIDAKRVDSGDPDAPEELPGEGYANVVARFSPRSRVRVDEDVDIVVNAENLHFFDGQDPRHLGLIAAGSGPVGGRGRGGGGPSCRTARTRPGAGSRRG